MRRKRISEQRLSSAQKVSQSQKNSNFSEAAGLCGPSGPKVSPSGLRGPACIHPMLRNASAVLLGGSTEVSVGGDL